jgi:hypothetical protein
LGFCWSAAGLVGTRWSSLVLLVFAETHQNIRKWLGVFEEVRGHRGFLGARCREPIVTPCGAGHTDEPRRSRPPPPGNPVYWSNGVRAAMYSSKLAMVVYSPGQLPQTVRVAACVR